MNDQKEDLLKSCILYCIKNNDAKTSTEKILEFIKDDRSDTIEHCYSVFSGRQKELLEFPEYIAKEHFVLVNQIGKIHYWKNENKAKTTVELYNDFKNNKQ